MKVEKINLTLGYVNNLSSKSQRYYVARQWNERSEEEESELLDETSVSGLVFSSFRYDNPGPLARNNWYL